MFDIAGFLVKRQLEKIINCYCYECVFGREYPAAHPQIEITADTYKWNKCPCAECLSGLTAYKPNIETFKAEAIKIINCPCLDCVMPEKYKMPKLKYFDDIKIQKFAPSKYHYFRKMEIYKKDDKYYDYTDKIYEEVEFDKNKVIYYKGTKFDGKKSKYQTCYYVEKHTDSKIVMSNPRKDFLKYKNDEDYLYYNNFPWYIKNQYGYELLLSLDCGNTVCDYLSADLLDMNEQTIRNIIWYKKLYGFEVCYRTDVKYIYLDINTYSDDSNAAKIIDFKNEKTTIKNIVRNRNKKKYSIIFDYCFECNKYKGCCVPAHHIQPDPDEFKFVNPAKNTDDEYVEVDL